MDQTVSTASRHSQPADVSLSPEDAAALTGQIVAAFVTQNKLPPSELPGVIASVHASLSSLGSPQVAEPAALIPLMPIKKTLTPDYLISLEDGRRYKSLKRHLTGRGLTPAGYREKWGLGRDYPMVAPNYAKQRSELAKALGLGQQRRKRPAEGAETLPATQPAEPKRKRGRPRSVPA